MMQIIFLDPQAQFWDAIIMSFVLQVNPEMVGRLEKAGLSFTGKDITGRRMEV